MRLGLGTYFRIVVVVSVTAIFCCACRSFTRTPAYVTGNGFDTSKYGDKTIAVLPIAVNAAYPVEGLPVEPIRKELVKQIEAFAGLGKLESVEFRKPDIKPYEYFPLTPSSISRAELVGDNPPPARIGISVVGWTSEDQYHAASVSLVISFVDSEHPLHTWTLAKTYSAERVKDLPHAIASFGSAEDFMDVRRFVRHGRHWWTMGDTINANAGEPTLALFAKDLNQQEPIRTALDSVKISVTAIDDRGILTLNVRNDSATFNTSLLRSLESDGGHQPSFFNETVEVPLVAGRNEVVVDTFTARENPPPADTSVERPRNAHRSMQLVSIQGAQQVHALLVTNSGQFTGPDESAAMSTRLRDLVSESDSAISGLTITSKGRLRAGKVVALSPGAASTEQTLDAFEAVNAAVRNKDVEIVYLAGSVRWYGDRLFFESFLGGRSIDTAPGVPLDKLTMPSNPIVGVLDVCASPNAELSALPDQLRLVLPQDWIAKVSDCKEGLPENPDLLGNRLLKLFREPSLLLPQSNGRLLPSDVLKYLAQTPGAIIHPLSNTKAP